MNILNKICFEIVVFSVIRKQAIFEPGRQVENPLVSLLLEGLLFHIDSASCSPSSGRPLDANVRDNFTNVVTARVNKNVYK